MPLRAGGSTLGTYTQITSRCPGCCLSLHPWKGPRRGQAYIHLPGTRRHGPCRQEAGVPSVPEGLGAVPASQPPLWSGLGEERGGRPAGPSEAQEEWAPPVSRAGLGWVDSVPRTPPSPPGQCPPPRKSPVGAAGGLSGKGQGCWGLGPWCLPAGSSSVCPRA